MRERHGASGVRGGSDDGCRIVSANGGRGVSRLDVQPPVQTGKTPQVVPTAEDLSARQASEAAMSRQLRFERLIATASARLVRSEGDEVTGEVRRALEEMLGFIQLDCVALLTLATDRNSVALVESCVAVGVAPEVAAQIDWLRTFPWVSDRVVRQGLCFLAQSIEDLPQEAPQDRQQWQTHSVTSLLAIPLSPIGQVASVITGFTLGRPHPGLEEFIPRLRVLGEVIVNALLRQTAERKLRESENFVQTVLVSLQDPIAVLDRQGRILSVNAAWASLAQENGGADSLVALGVGGDYLGACRRALTAGQAAAGPALAGIESVLAGAVPRFACDYHATVGCGTRWFELVSQALKRAEGGAIVSHLDITSQRQAETEAQRLQDELTHVGRLASLGQLVAALAHEVNQPLTAILCNAQAAQNHVEHNRSEHRELVGILDDIVADTQRAGAIIRTVRASLKKGPSQPQPADLNRAVLEVVRMMRSAALLRAMDVVVNLDPNLPDVTADPIQVRQVLLNLISNAMDAMEDTPHGERQVQVQTRPSESGGVEVAVSDRGTGIPPDQLACVFEPFVTTKSQGLGIGLSICRSIVESHGGRITASNNPDRGATLTFSLPPAQAATG